MTEKVYPMHTSTAEGPPTGETPNSTLLARVTRAVRQADRAFGISGGTTRHWVRECFLPALEEAGLQIVESVPQESQS
jgi:hypothetical protein